MMRLLTILMVSAIAISASARILHVPEEFGTIQTGIDSSQNGDTVLVGPGEYPEVLTIRGQQILLTSSNGPYETTIQGRLLIGSFADTLGCIFQGFTLYDPNSDPWSGGPGINLISGKSRIIGNILRHHYLTGGGGGISSDFQPALVSHNIIEGNYAMNGGGGVYFRDTPDVEISYNIIRNNRSGYGVAGVGRGAGIYLSRAHVFYNLIYDNRVECYTYPGPDCGKGGGIDAWDMGETIIYNNTIVNNIAKKNGIDGEGGGIFAWLSQSNYLIIKNNIIAFNNRGGLCINYYPPESLYANPESYNLIYGNNSYDISAPETSQTDIFADPMFTDTSSYDYSLQPGSPCIDAGDPSFPLDPDSTRVDIGALFFDHSVSIDDSSKAIPFNFELHQNYPNPFNGQTTISYNLPSASIVSFTIFDITGHIIKKLSYNESQEAGIHRYIWDGTNNSGQGVSTAIYFYELQVNKDKIVKSMILIK